MDRRRFIGGLAAGALAAGGGVGTLSAAGRRPRSTAFLHGVASGDPAADGFVLWTRVSVDRPERTATVGWRVSDRPDMRRELRSGRLATGPGRDHTVKVILEGLDPGGTWYYQFESDGVKSPIGRARTLPDRDPGVVRLAVVSCSNYPAGYFHAYTDIADCQDIDAVIHLGDYIYEYGLGGYATENAEMLARVPDPGHETLSLGDYRRRHAQYKTDPSLQSLHASFPVITIWDDHELTNDAWLGGAQNHQAGEGDWGERRAAALQAYDEWMPITPLERTPPRRYRRFDYGGLMDLLLLDTRVAGRDQQIDLPRSDDDFERFRAELGDPSRSLLGKVQEDWLDEQIAASGSRWQLLAQQVLVAPMLSPDLRPVVDVDGPSTMPRERLENVVNQSALGLPLLLDTWDGYPPARQRLLQSLRRAANPLVLSGDLHTAIHTELVDSSDDRLLAHEFVTPAVSSPGLGSFLPPRHPGAIEAAFRKKNPHLRHLDLNSNGWLLVTISDERCEGEWRRVSTVLSPDFNAETAYRTSVLRLR